MFNAENQGGAQDNRQLHDKEVIVVHYADYADIDDDYNDDYIKHLKNEAKNKIQEDIIEIIYKEGNSDIDPTKMIVDTGCPKHF